MSYKFNPFTGNLDLVGEGDTILGADNFSYFEVAEFNTVTIPEGQEMLFKRDLMVRGDLLVRGDAVQLADASEQSFFWSEIPSTTTVRVPVNRLMLYVSPFMVRGNLFVSGLLKEV